MSIEPTSVSACATAARMLSWSVTSSATTWASPPSPSMRAQLLELVDAAAGQHHGGAGPRQRAGKLGPGRWRRR
jgi:hypothetical protein